MKIQIHELVQDFDNIIHTSQILVKSAFLYYWTSYVTDQVRF